MITITEIARRKFLQQSARAVFGAACAPWLGYLQAPNARGAAASAPVTPGLIKLDFDRKLGAIDRNIYGNFTEHLGRCIYGGIYEERSPLSDCDGFRKDVLKAARNIHVSVLRWPGGNFSSGYNWKDGIGPKDQRPRRWDTAWQEE